MALLHQVCPADAPGLAYPPGDGWFQETHGPMKVLYTSDLHGRRNLYEALFTMAADREVQVVILGGDLLPHHGPFQDTVVEQEEFVISYLQLALEDYCSRSPDVRIYTLLGNNDWLESHKVMAKLEKQGLIQSLDGKRLDLGERYQIIGHGNVNPTPFRIKDGERLDWPGDEVPTNMRGCFCSQGRKVIAVDPQIHYRHHPSMAEELEGLPQPLVDRNLIVVIHAPPRNTGLDVMEGGIHVGSRAVRHYIERLQPCLALHGHIHEAPEVSDVWIEHLGPTVCVNPGQAPDQLHAVVFQLDEVPGEFEHTVYGKPL
jgi:uncharacterized protein